MRQLTENQPKTGQDPSITVTVNNGLGKYDNMTDDAQLFISSHIAQTPPEYLEETLRAIMEHPHADVPMVDDKGKLVVLIDAPTSKDAIKTIESIQSLANIYSFTPVYQHEEV
ncbi:chaperone NapD [Kiloniella sp.]|uniref:chaperone NapD n=1 Tax=Kiloniella sp. TaxID=1938587 RepID=UPI003A90B54B